MHFSIDAVNQETCGAFQSMRGGFYVGYQIKAAQLLACYQTILATTERQNLWADTSLGLIMVLGVAEDIRDSESFNLQLSRRLSIEKYLENVTDDMMEEFIPGSPHHALFRASLGLAHGEFTGMELESHEKEEIMTTLRECYWASPGISEDYESKRRRLCRLCAMFLKYDMFRYIKEHLLLQEIDNYFLIQNQRRDFKMPSDMLSYALGSLVCQEEHSRSDEVVAKLLEIMATPDEIMDERTKLFGMLYILRGS